MKTPSKAPLTDPSSAEAPTPSATPGPSLPPRLDALLRLGALGRLARTGWVLAGVPAPESVAAHSLGVAHLVLTLGPAVRPALDVPRAAALAVLHDAPEALLGDLPRAASELFGQAAKHAAERAAGERLLAPLGPLASELSNELFAGATREARFVRVCDRLHLGVELLWLVRAGQRGLDEFLATVRALDAGEFAPCAELARELVHALEGAAAGRG